MRIAFYAPLKPPDHPRPSGDRRVARLLMTALALAGHEVTLAARLRSWDGRGDPVRQARLAAMGGRLAQRLLRRYGTSAARPQAWLTYHLYYKAPDWIGPRVTAALGIPYVIAEASVAHKRAAGAWALGHQATLDAVAQAHTIIALNPADVPALPATCRVERLRPFLDTAPYSAAAARRSEARAALTRQHALDASVPWLLAVAMMRPGDKLASYRLLAAGLARLTDRPWHVLLVGDGPARDAVRAAFDLLPAERLHWLGARDPEALPALYAAADLLVWPAIGEAYGMALLEAQAAGLPVVAGSSGGVDTIVRDGATGVLAPPGDAAAFAAAVRDLLGDPGRRRSMGAAARAAVAADHGLAQASARLDAIVREAVTAR